jgi:glycine betaine/proline transport system substrate-binding protein
MKSRFGHTLLLAALSTVLLAGCSEQWEPGKSVRFAQSDSLGANYVVTQIGIAATRQLGYRVTLSTVGTTMFFLAAERGDLDIDMDINFPQQDPGFQKVSGKVAIVGRGQIAGGGTNGYMIDRKTAEANGITNLGQLKDPRIATLFGRDGKADLINCDASWSCGEVVDYQLDSYGLTPTVRSIKGKYEALMAEAITRVRREEPALFYSWSPSWMNKALVPGRDVVWLPTPYEALPPSVPRTGTAMIANVQGCAGGQNPCRMAMAAWNYRAVANKKFIAGHADLQRLFTLMDFPVAQWSAWEDAISKPGGGSDRAIKTLARDWIDAHRSQFEGWIAAARNPS